jgi:hypothetical protein
MYGEVKPIISYDLREVCLMPYHNHPKGCPNWNKKEGCPPQAEKIEDIIDIKKPIYVIRRLRWVS